MLRRRVSYGADDATLEGQVSLSDAGVSMTFAKDALGSVDRRTLESLTTDFRRSVEELSNFAEVMPFVDPVLHHRRSDYENFTKDVANRIIIS